MSKKILENFIRSVLLEIKLNQVEGRFESKPFIKWADRALRKDFDEVPWKPYEDEAREKIMSAVTAWMSAAQGPQGEAARSQVKDIESEAALALDWFITALVNGRTQMEDIDKLFDGSDPELGYLGKFLLHKRKLAKKDLRAYASPADLFVALKPLTAEQSQRVDPTKIPDLELFARDARGSIWIPKTVEASCAVGKGTEWCTAKYPPGDERNMFSSYNEAGPLYVYFDNRLGKRFQAWKSEDYEDPQMMDEDDTPVEHVPFLNLLRQNGINMRSNDLVSRAEGRIYEPSGDTMLRIAEKLADRSGAPWDGYIPEQAHDSFQQILLNHLRDKQGKPQEILDMSPSSDLTAALKDCVEIVAWVLAEQQPESEDDIYAAADTESANLSSLFELIIRKIRSLIENAPQVIN